MENKFIRVRSIKDIIISSLLIISGCTLILIPSSVGINILGFSLLFVGVLLAFLLKNAYMDSVSGEKFNKNERFFSHENLDMLKAALACPDKIDFNKEDRGSSVRMDTYFNKTKVYAQLFEYVPYTYEPCSTMHEYTFEKGCKLIGK